MAEFSIIDQYFNRQSYTDVTLGIGDDSALITPPVNQQLVICADTLVAGRHFPLDTSAHAIGWKSVAVNLSDIAAMGAKPHSILLALSLPTIDHEWLEGFSQEFMTAVINLALLLLAEIRLKALISPLLLRPWAGLKADKPCYVQVPKSVTMFV